MSIDFSLTEVKETEIFDSNMTHNVTPMWREAGCYDALYMSDGMKAKDVTPFLELGVKNMESNPEKFIKLNAENGWGTYEHALPFLKEVLNSCVENPESIIRISK